MAIILGAGAGAGAAGGFMWFSAGGIYLQGPLGFSLSAGYFSVAASGGACLAGAGAALAVGGFFYLVPWDWVFEYIKHLLWRIWHKVCDAVSELWEKAKSWASAMVSSISLPSAHHGPKPARFAV